MSKIKKTGGILLAVVMLAMLIPSQVFAASSQVKVTGGSVTVGSTITMTCTVTTTGSAIGGADVELGYDATALEPTGSSGTANAMDGKVYYSDYVSRDGQYSLSFNVTFRVVKSGNHKITVDRAEVYDFSNNPVSISSKTAGTISGTSPAPPSGGGSGSGSGSGTGSGSGSGSGSGGSSSGGGSSTQQPSKDTNNKLKSLQVYPGTLTPAFDAGTTAYSMQVPSDVREVTISATPQSSKARVTVSGGKDLKPGINTAQVVVIAESGASRAYTITIMCGEDEQIKISDATYTIDEDFTDEQIPTGFSRTKVTYKEREYEGLTNAAGNMTLLSLKNDTGANYFIYNQNSLEFYTFVQIVISEGKYIVPFPLGKDVAQFSKNETISLTIQDKKFDVWKLDDEFSVAYVMNQDGKMVLYRYDSVDGVFQRYTDTELKVSETEVKPGFLGSYYMYTIIGLGALCLILLGGMIYFIASRKQRHEGRKKKALRKMERRRIKEEKALEKERIAEEKAAAKQRAYEEKMLAKEQESEVGSGNKVLIWLIVIVAILVVAGCVVIGFGVGNLEEMLYEFLNMIK